MDQTAWIIGAGPGIGRAAAERFRTAGFGVGVVGRPGEDLGLEGGVVMAPADAFDPSALHAALEALEARLGLPSVLIYNASFGSPGSLVNLPPSEAAGQLAGAAQSLLACVTRVIPAMTAAGRGTLLITGGGLAFAPKPGLALPSAVKALQRSLALSLAEELAPMGIHVATLAVCGFVQSDAPLNPEAVAQALWDLHAEAPGAWTHERRLPVA